MNMTMSSNIIEKCKDHEQVFPIGKARPEPEDKGDNGWGPYQSVFWDAGERGA